MSAKFTTKIRNVVADSLINIDGNQSYPAFNKNMFVAIGKNTAWPDENNPPAAGVLDLDDYTTLENIIALKKITSDNFRLAVKRIDWQSGAIYSAYHHSKDPMATSGPTEYDNPFFVFTGIHLYKCLDNNNGAESTGSPTGTSTNTFTLNDGYVWKYIGSLSANSSGFLTSAYVPVNRILSNDSSPQWLVQQAAKKQSLSAFTILANSGTFPNDTAQASIVGGTPSVPAEVTPVVDVNDVLTQVVVDNPGEGYDITSRIEAIVQKSTAVGSGATVSTITLNSGAISTVSVGEPGTNYTSAICILVDPVNTPTQEAQLTVIITGGSVSAINVVQGQAGAGYSSSVRGYIIPGNAGAIASAVIAPKEGHGNNIVTELCANTVLISVRLSGYSEYLLTGDKSFRQVSLITDVRDFGTSDYSANLMYIGPSHPDYDEGTLNRIERNVGYVLYVNNLESIIRSEGQEEEIKFSISM